MGYQSVNAAAAGMTLKDIIANQVNPMVYYKRSPDAGTWFSTMTHSAMTHSMTQLKTNSKMKSFGKTI